MLHLLIDQTMITMTFHIEIGIVITKLFDYNKNKFFQMYSNKKEIFENIKRERKFGIPPYENCLIKIISV